jgi:branched-chain amino acid transport system permease protein
MKLLLQLLIPGLCLGCVYGLNGVGSALLYKGSRTINNAQGAIIGLGSIVGYTIQQRFGLGLLPATLIATVISFFFGMFLQAGVVSRIEKRSPINIVIATLALNLILTSANNLIFGTYVYESAVIMINGSKYLHIDAANIDILWSNVVAIGVSLASMLLIHLFLNKTKFGTGMRAAAMDSMAAESCGINTVLTRAVTWGIIAALGCLGGCLSGPLFGVSVFIGKTIGNKGNTGAVLGGYGNMYGAIIGGIIVGLVETMFGFMWSQYQQAFTNALFLIFILFFPRGIMNEKAIEEG